METLLNLAAAVWNPTPEIRRRLQEGRLTVKAVLPLFVPIALAGSLLVSEAQSFFSEALEKMRMTYELPVGNSPIWTNDFARKFMTVLVLLAPVGAVALLPSRTFAPVSRSETVASLIILVAAFTFYLVALAVLVYFFSAIIVLVSPQFGIVVQLIALILGSFLIFWLMAGFWAGALFEVLGLTNAAFARISVCYLGSVVVVGVLYSYLLSL